MIAFNKTKYRNLSYSKPEGKYCNDESDFDQKQQVIFCGHALCDKYQSQNDTDKLVIAILIN